MNQHVSLQLKPEAVRFLASGALCYEGSLIHSHLTRALARAERNQSLDPSSDAWIIRLPRQTVAELRVRGTDAPSCHFRNQLVHACRAAAANHTNSNPPCHLCGKAHASQLFAGDVWAHDDCMDARY